MNLCKLFFKKILIAVQLLYNVVLASAAQQCESALCWHISPPAGASLPPPQSHSSRSSQSTQLSSPCYTAAFHQLAILHMDVYILEKAMAPHSSTLAWEIPWTEEPGRLQSMRLQRVGYDWVTSLSLFTFMHWRRKWQLTPVFLPGESLGRGSLVGCRLWGRTESDTTERLGGSSSVYKSNVTLIHSILSLSCCVHKSLLSVCTSVPALQIGTSVPFSKIPYICVNMYKFLK